MAQPALLGGFLAQRDALFAEQHLTLKAEAEATGMRQYPAFASEARRGEGCGRRPFRGAKARITPSLPLSREFRLQS